MPSISESIAAGADDAHSDLGALTDLFYSTLNRVVWGEITAGPTTGSSDLQLQTFGLRFTSIDIPQGATISSAGLTVQARQELTSTGGDPTAQIWGEDVDNSTAWNSTSNGPANRTKTTSASTLTPTTTTYSSYEIDVTSIVQDIVNRAGWASSNDMAFIGEQYPLLGTIDRLGYIGAYESTLTEAQLDVTYTTGSTAAATFVPKMNVY